MFVEIGLMVGESGQGQWRAGIGTGPFCRGVPSGRTAGEVLDDGMASSCRGFIFLVNG